MVDVRSPDNQVDSFPVEEVQALLPTEQVAVIGVAAKSKYLSEDVVSQTMFVGKLQTHPPNASVAQDIPVGTILK